jgi:hypothetical protein
MKYATYEIYITVENPSEGTAPHDTIRSNGKFIETAFGIGNGKDVCYIGDDIAENDFPNWNFKIITQSKALELALAINKDSYLAEDGKIVMPFDDPYRSSFNE